MNKYVLGVDGGNTKTDYLLFDLEGNFIDGIRKGTISHEALKNSFAESKELLKAHLDELLNRNHIQLEDIVSSAFGLAGIDTKNQKKSMEQVLTDLSFKNYVVYNDGFLPIKIGATHKYGVSVINGTGTVICGIDRDQYCQVGGFGLISSDDAGGSYLVRQVVKAVYSSLYRNRRDTALKSYLFELLGITDLQRENFMELAIQHIIGNRKLHSEIIQRLFQEVEKNDSAALDIIRHSAHEIANGVVGCIHELNLNQIEIILAGSVFVHCNSKFYFNEMENEIKRHLDRDFKFILVEEVPAVGAILWSLELAGQEASLMKTKIKEEIKKYQY